MSIKDNFNKKDMLLLDLLTENSRAPINELSKKSRLSKATVKRKIDSFKEKGIIKKFIPIIDFTKFNFETPLFYISFKEVNEKQEQEIINYLINQDEIGWCTKTLGVWNAAFATFVRSPSDIFIILNKILNKFPNKILNYHIGLTMQVLDKRSKDTIVMNMKDKTIVKLSKKERIILKEMDDNCRSSFIDIEKRNKMSYRTFKRSLNSLISKGIIKSFSCQTNYYPLGLEKHALLIKLRKRNEKEIIRLISFLRSIKGLAYMVRLAGDYDLDVNFWLKERLEIEKIISELKLKFSELINHIEHLVYLEEYKLTYLPHKIS